MLDFGFSEILLTSAIALIVLGPERLPKVARQVGNWMGRARAMARQLSEQPGRQRLHHSIVHLPAALLILCCHLLWCVAADSLLGFFGNACKVLECHGQLGARPNFTQTEERRSAC